MKNHIHASPRFRRRAQLLAAISAVAAIAGLRAADYNYSGGTVPQGSVNGGDNILIDLGVSTSTYQYDYTEPGAAAPATHAIATGTANKSTGNAAFTLSPEAVSTNGGVTFKPNNGGNAGDTRWAVLDANPLAATDKRQLIVINEPTTGSNYAVTLDKVILQNGQATNTNNGGAMQFSGGTYGQTPLLKINGDAVFLDNTAGGQGGAISTGWGSVEFAGNVVFDSNKSGYENSAFARASSGGAIRFQATTGNLTFRKDAIFIGNQSGGAGGAVYATGNGAKNFVFEGKTVFEGNSAGNFAGATGHGGGLYAYTGATFTFTGTAASFVKNAAFSGYGGAINSRDGNVTFTSTGAYAGSPIFSFVRNVSTAATNSLGGGAIHIDQTSGGSLIFSASNAMVTFQGNAAGGSGGAVRVGVGVSLQRGSFVFQGNQAGMTGGAIYASNGAVALTPSGAYRIDVRTSATFASNLAINAGGAIAATQNADNSMYFGTDAAGSSIVFSNNVSGTGGAIYATNGSTRLVFNASGGDITFTGNRQGVSFIGSALNFASILAGSGADATGYYAYTAGSGVANDIYFNSNNMTVSLDAAAGRTITFDGGFSAASTGNNLNVGKTGAGTVIFSRQDATPLGVNTNDLKTTTTVDGGSFLLAKGAIYGSGAGTITAASGATLGGHGTFKETATVKGGATLLVGDRNSMVAQALVFNGNLTLGETGSANRAYFDLLGSTGADGAYDQIIVNGTLAATGTQIFDVTGIGTGTYALISSGNNLSAAGASFRVQSNGADLTSRYSAAISQTATSILLSSSMQNFAMQWTAAGNLWQDNVGTNWNTASDATEHYFRNGDAVAFAAAQAGAVTISSAGVKVFTMNVDVAAGGTYAFSGGSITASSAAADTTLTGSNAKLTKTGAGTLVFSNSANTFGGGIDIDGGTLAFNNGAQLGVGASKAITFTNNATLKASANAAGSLTLASALAVNAGRTATLDLAGSALALTGGLTGSGNIDKTGAHDLSFAGNGSTYTGTISLTTGKFSLANAASLGGVIRLAGSSTLSGSGTASAGTVTAANGTVIAPGSGGAPSTLNLSSLTIDSATLRFELFNGANASGYSNSDTLNVATAFSASGTNIIDVFGVVQSGTSLLGHNLASLFTGYSGTTIVLFDGQVQVQGARKGASLSSNGADLLLISISDISRTMTWTGSAGGDWNISEDNWTDGGATKKFGGGDHVIFGNTGAARNTINIIGSGQQAVSDMTVNGTANYTFNGQGISAKIENLADGSTLAAQGKLFKAGSGTLTFNNAANYFEGGIDISGGVIAFNNAGQLATSATAAIRFTGAGGALLASADAMTLASTLDVASGATGVLNTQGHAFALTGSLTGAGTFAKTGTGALLFSGDGANFNGATAVTQGAFVLDQTGTLGGTVNLAGSTILAGAGVATGTVNAAAGSVISVGLPGAADSGTLTIGMLKLAAGAYLASTGTEHANTLDGGLVVGNAPGDQVFAAIDAGARLTLSTTTSGAGSIVKTGSGTLVIDSELALGNTGATVISEGVVELRNIAAPATFNKSVDLAGGWLDISSGGATPDEATATHWDALAGNIAYSGTTGGIRGSNDMITWRSGTVAYGLSGGILVVIDPGADASVNLAGGNAYTGYTRVDSGTLNIATSENLGASANTLVLNGGALQVTATSGNAGSTSRKLELRADGAIGVAGNSTFAIGTSSDTGGAHALTKNGTGVLNLSAASTRTGATNLQEGTISAGNSTALGAGMLNVTGTAATLQIGASNITLANNIALNANTLTVNAGNTGTLAGVISGQGGITKTGNSVLTLTAPSTYSGATTVATGTLRAGAAAAFSGNSVFVVNGAQNATSMANGVFPTLDLGGFDQSISSLNSKGTVNLAGARLNLGGGAGTFTNAGNIILGNTPGARPEINGNLVAADSGNAGFPANIKARIALDAGGRVTAYDQLLVRGNVSGQTSLAFVMSGPGVTPAGSGTLPGGAKTPALVPDVNAIIADLNGQGIVVATGSMASNAFVAAVYPNRVFDADGNELIPVVDGGKATLGGTISPEVPATVGIDAIAYLAGKAALDSLSSRLTDLRLDNADANHGMDLWLHGMHTHDKINDTIYAGSTVNTTGAQVGLDYADHGGRNKDDVHFTLGVFGDYLVSELRQPNAAKTEAEIYGFGLYGTYQRGGFSFDALFRASTDSYKITVDRSPGIELTGNTFAGSLQLSYHFAAGRGWHLEPQLQGTAQRTKINSSTDYIGRTFTLDSIDSLTGRAGLLVWRKYQAQSGFAFIPHARASFFRDFRGDTTVHVGRGTYNGDLGETAGQVDLGAIFRFSETIDATLNLMYFNGQKIDSYSGNAGIRVRW